MSGDQVPRKCVQCGALAPRLEARFCEYCGTDLPQPAKQQVVSTPAAPFGDLEARFGALQRSPQLDELMAHDPSGRADRLWWETGCLLSFGILFVIVGLTVTSGFGMVFPAMALVPIAMVVIGVIAIGKQLIDGLTTISAELERTPACVIDERTKLSGGGDGPTRTHYFVTLALPGGERRELEAQEDVAGMVTRGDFGVAYFKSRLLLDFRIAAE